MKRKKYFKNNVKLLQGVPDEHFESITYDEFMDWKIHGYEIPDEICCILRERNVDTGKVKEHVYQYRHAARNKAQKLMKQGNVEITVVQRDAVHFIPPIHYHDII